MSQRGVYFALTSEDAQKVREAKNDLTLRSVIQDDIEERWDEEWLFQTDKGWAAIHRCLTDGRLAYDNGEYPLRACVLGAAQLHEGDDFIVSFLTPEQVKDVATALASVNRGWLRSRYSKLDPAEYGLSPTDDDFDYVWSCFDGLPAFFAKAASAARAVMFTVDL
jgi:hypothetical protein